MKRSYWENMAPTYNEEIFDVLKQDKKSLIKKAIKKYSNEKDTVIDIGCAIGKWLPVLSPLFKKVIALDISQGNLDIAKKKFSKLENIDYLRADMSKAGIKLPKVNLAICINAILTPTKKDRQNFFKALSNCINKKGILIASVPAMESKLLALRMQNEFGIERRLFKDIYESKEAKRHWHSLLNGNIEIDNIPHKHFSKEELEILFDKAGFDTLDIQKIEYNWNTEFHNPPRFLKNPGPWDWMIVVQKR